MDKKTLNGHMVYVHTADKDKTWIRAYELILAMGLSLSKQQVDAKLAGTAMAHRLGAQQKWFVSFPRGMRMLLNKCRPYNPDGRIFKLRTLASAKLVDLVEEEVNALVAGPDLPATPAKKTAAAAYAGMLTPAAVMDARKRAEKLDSAFDGMMGTPCAVHDKKLKSVGELLADMLTARASGSPVTMDPVPSEAATVVAALQQQLKLVNEKNTYLEARITQLTDMVAENMKMPPATRPLASLPPRSLRATIRLHVASYATKMVYANGLTRKDPRVSNWYERVWANLYSEFAARVGVDFRRRFNNMSEDARKKAGVSSAVDMMSHWVCGVNDDGVQLPYISDGMVSEKVPEAYVGVLPEFHALVCELCPVERFYDWQTMPDAIRHSFIDGLMLGGAYPVKEAPRGKPTKQADAPQAF